MARDFYINGESMVYVKGRSDSAIGSRQELGLAEGPIQVQFEFVQEDLNLDAWGPRIPPDVQSFLAAATITMGLIHFDPTIVEVCEQEAICAPAWGLVGRAGHRLGNNQPQFTGGTNGNRYVSLSIASPVEALPFRFLTAYLTGNLTLPLGTRKSVKQLTWRAIPYQQDPWGGGTGAYNAVLCDHTLDT